MTIPGPPYVAVSPTQPVAVTVQATSPGQVVISPAGLPGPAGGTLLGVRAVSADTTLTTADGVLLIDATTGNLTVGLLNPALVTGQPFYLKRTDSAMTYVTVTPYASETIDGADNGYLPNPAAAIALVSDGTNWWIF